MPAEGREEWATKNVVFPPTVKARLEAARAYPKEALWRVTERLLDEHDSLRDRTPAAVPTLPLHGASEASP